MHKSLKIIKKYDNNSVIIENIRQNKWFILDISDIPILENFSWYNKHGYIVCTNYRAVRNDVSLHRILMMNELLLPENKGKEIDHINRIKHDNRRCNLRVISHRENNYNKSISDSTLSGMIGISPAYYHKNTDKWLAIVYNSSISKYGKRLGMYSDKYLAAFAYDYYILHNYPDQIKLATNYYLNRYPKDILIKYNIHSIYDIPNPRPLRQGDNFNNLYYGICKNNKCYKPYEARVSIKHKIIRVGDRYNTIEEAILAREIYLNNHPELKNQRNIVYPDFENGLISPLGFLKTKKEH